MSKLRHEAAIARRDRVLCRLHESIRLCPNERISVSEDFHLAHVASFVVRDGSATCAACTLLRRWATTASGEANMRATERLHREGQSLWLDHITRKMIDSGQLARYVEQYSVTGLTSNPSIFDKAMAPGDYETEIRDKAARGVTGETLFFDLAIENLQRAADLFLPIWRIDSFDQWGVELGEALANRIAPELEAAGEPALAHDSTTSSLIRRYRSLER